MGFKCDNCSKDFIHNGACLKKHIAECLISKKTVDYSHLIDNVMINNRRGSDSRQKIKNVLIMLDQHHQIVSQLMLLKLLQIESNVLIALNRLLILVR